MREAKEREAAAALEDIDKLAEMTPEEVKAHTEEAKKAELAANPALAEARRFITQRQIEAKGKEHSEEIREMFIKLQTRLSAAQNEVVTSRKLAQSVEQRLAARSAPWSCKSSGGIAPCPRVHVVAVAV